MLFRSRSRPDQVSGLPQHYQGSHVTNLYALFRDAVEAAMPGEIARLEEADAARRAAATRAAPARFWKEVGGGGGGSGDGGSTAPFTFGFGGGDDDDSDASEGGP